MWTAQYKDVNGLWQTVKWNENGILEPHPFKSEAEALTHAKTLGATVRVAYRPNYKPTLPVIFRKFYSRDRREWDVEAFFPTLPSDSSYWWNMTCYAHIGQHSGADPAYMQKGKPAKPEEYAELLAELRDIYEDDEDYPCTLKVYQREQSYLREARKRNWKRSRP